MFFFSLFFHDRYCNMVFCALNSKLANNFGCLLYNNKGKIFVIVSNIIISSTDMERLFRHADCLLT